MARYLSTLLLLLGAASVQAVPPFQLHEVKPATLETVRAREPGILDEILISVGDEVRTGQLLAKLDNDKQTYAFTTAKLKAENRGAMEVAEGEVQERGANVNDLVDRLRKRMATVPQVDAAKGKARAALGKLEQTKMAYELAKLDAEMAERALERRFFRAPFSGTIIEVVKQRGEKAIDGEVVITIADMSELSAVIPLSKESAAGLKNGSTFLVRQPGTNISRVARIDSVSPMAKGTKGEQMAKIVFDNPDPSSRIASIPFEVLLPEGMQTVPIVKDTPAPKPPDTNKKPTTKG